MKTDLETQETEAHDTPAVPEGFAVRDQASANWLIRKIVESRQYAQRVEAWAAAELRRAEAEERFFWLRYGTQLEAWARGQLEAAHSHHKSIHLPAGCVGYRTLLQRLLVRNEDRLLGWCQANLPKAVVTTHAVLKSVVSEHLKSTGEVPDGAELGGGEQKFYIK
jgi:hypothetical protein